MRRARIRNALVLMLVICGLTGLWWDTVVDLDARQRAYDRIQPGMTIPQVERLMRWPGKVQFNTVGGNLEIIFREWERLGTPHLFVWEDPYTTVLVEFRAPEPNPPVVVRMHRDLKNPPELESLLFWRVVLAGLWVVGVYLLLRGLLTPKPDVALTSPPISDTPDAAASPPE